MQKEGVWGTSPILHFPHYPFIFSLAVNWSNLKEKEWGREGEELDEMKTGKKDSMVTGMQIRWTCITIFYPSFHIVIQFVDVCWTFIKLSARTKNRYHLSPSSHFIFRASARPFNFRHSFLLPGSFYLVVKEWAMVTYVHWSTGTRYHQRMNKVLFYPVSRTSVLEIFSKNDLTGLERERSSEWKIVSSPFLSLCWCLDINQNQKERKIERSWILSAHSCAPVSVVVSKKRNGPRTRKEEDRMKGERIFRFEKRDWFSLQWI